MAQSKPETFRHAEEKRGITVLDIVDTVDIEVAARESLRGCRFNHKQDHTSKEHYRLINSTHGLYKLYIDVCTIMEKNKEAK